MKETNPENSNDNIPVFQGNPRKSRSFYRPAYRKVILSRKENCLVPSRVDDIYNGIKDTISHTNTSNINQEVQCKIQSSHRTTEDTMIGQKLCLSKIAMTFKLISPNVTEVMPNVCNHIKATSPSFGTCHCDKGKNIQILDNINCICKIESYSFSENHDPMKNQKFYYKMNCTPYTKNSYDKLISNCTITNKHFSFEQRFFKNKQKSVVKIPSYNKPSSLINTQYSNYERIVMKSTDLSTEKVTHASYNSGNSMYDTVAWRHTHILLLLLFHLFIYFGVLKKEHMNIRRKTNSKR